MVLFIIIIITHHHFWDKSSAGKINIILLSTKATRTYLRGLSRLFAKYKTVCDVYQMPNKTFC
jgi:hypothetical protein